MVLAKFINADPATQGFFVFFGTDLQLWPEDVELVELAVTRGV